MMVKSVDILCIQETMWKGSKARKIGDSFKLFYHGDGGRKHRIGVTEGSLIVTREESFRGEWRAIRCTLVHMKLDIEGVMMMWSVHICSTSRVHV